MRGKRWDDDAELEKCLASGGGFGGAAGNETAIILGGGAGAGMGMAILGSPAAMAKAGMGSGGGNANGAGTLGITWW